METMHYNEKKKNSKGIIIAVISFVLIGAGIIIFALTSESEPVVIGSQESDIQRLVELDKEDKEKTKSDNANINYEIKDENYSDKSNSYIKSNITLPKVFIEGDELKEFNDNLEVEYNQLFNKLKEQMSGSVESKYTYIVSYNFYENMIGTNKIISLALYQRVRDDSASKNTTEKVTTYNIDLSSKKEVELSEVAQVLLDKDYKTTIKSAIEDYVVENGMMKSSDFTYAVTGLEDYYIKEGVFHIILNEGTLVDSKYGVLDIEVTKK